MLAEVYWQMATNNIRLRRGEKPPTKEERKLQQTVSQLAYLKRRSPQGKPLGYEYADDQTVASMPAYTPSSMGTQPGPRRRLRDRLKGAFSELTKP